MSLFNSNTLKKAAIITTATVATVSVGLLAVKYLDLGTVADAASELADSDTLTAASEGVVSSLSNLLS